MRVDAGEIIIERCTNWDHADKICKCCRCGIVRRCSPDFDFYAKEDGDPLFCEICLRDELEKRGIKLGDGFKPLNETMN